MSKVNEQDLVTSGAIPPNDFHNSIGRVREIAPFDLEIPDDLDKRLRDAISGLIIPPEILKAATAAIQVGHVVFQGPPGTGKTSLARALAKAFNASTFAVTAHEDWTIYDVIGRLELRLSEERKEEVVPVNGSFTEAVIRCANNVVRHFDDPSQPQAEWLLIDELNRAHLDKAFGELFTVLGTDDLVPINLPHQKEGNRELVIPRRFRIIATLNSYDRQFVNSLSQAIRRRFTFLSLDIPPRRPPDVKWTNELSSPHLAIQEYATVVKRAAARCARRGTSLNPEKLPQQTTEFIKLLSVEHEYEITRLFDFVEKVRYAEEGNDLPHIPIGTAQLVDTLELFLSRVMQERGGKQPNNAAIDWAVAVKLVPLFESDVVSPDSLKRFAEQLDEPFSKFTKRELLSIAASGLHFVPHE